MKFPTFGGYEIKIIITRCLAKALLKYEHTKNIDPTAYTGLTVHVKEEHLTYIFLPLPDTGTMAHEAYHAVCNLLKVHDIPQEGEVVAYHLGYVMREIVDLALA